MPQGLVAGYNTLWIDGSPCVLGECPKGIPFLFIYKKKKGTLLIGMLKDVGWGCSGKGGGGSSNFPLRP